MLILALLPIIIHHVSPLYPLQAPSTRIFKAIAILFVGCSLFLVPELFNDMGSGMGKLFSDPSAGAEAYHEQMKTAAESGTGISNIPSVIFNALSDIAIFILFYFLSIEKKNKWLIGGLFFAIIVYLVTPITKGERGGVIIAALTVLGAYFLFKEYLSRKINHIVRVMGVSLAILITLPIAAITISRFGSRQAGGVMQFIDWYVGQGSLYFNNYGLDANGTRHGNRTLNLFKRVIDPSTPKNFVERRDQNRFLNIDDNLFVSFVGDFTIDFGPITAAIIFLIFFPLMTRLSRPRDGTLHISQMLILYFVMCVTMQGGMTLFSYSDTGNLKMIAIFMLYIYLEYHDRLLQKFPLYVNR